MAGGATEKIGPVKVSTYGVSGDTLADVCEALGGEKEAGAVRWNPKFDYAQEDGKVTSVTIEVKIDMELPKWSVPSSLGKNAKAEWERWSKALRAHEDGHVKIVEEKFAGVAKSMLGQTEAKAKAAFAKALADCKKASDTYDKGNDHGRKAGTVLDDSITD